MTLPSLHWSPVLCNLPKPGVRLDKDTGWVWRMDSRGLQLSTLVKHLQAAKVRPGHPRESAPPEEVCQEGNFGCYNPNIKWTIACCRICFPELGLGGRHLTGDPLALISLLKVFVSIVGEQVGLGQVRMKEKVNMVLSFLFILTFLRPLNRTKRV